MKALKLVLVFVLILGGIFGAIYFMSTGSSTEATGITEVSATQQCDRCLQEFKNIETHKKSCNHYACKICGKNTWFKSQEDLENHMNNKHRSSDERSEPGDNKGGHTNYATEATDVSKRPATQQCDRCLQVFKNLETHKKICNHYACKICGKNTWFKSQEDLENHMNRKHGDGGRTAKPVNKNVHQSNPGKGLIYKIKQ